MAICSYVTRGVGHLPLPTLLAWCLTVTICFAETYPNRPVTLVVPSAAGGGLDTLARGIAEQLSLRVGVPVIVENKPGGNNQIAAQYVEKAKPDGYTLFVAPETTFVVNPHIYKSLAYDIKDFEPISALAAVYQALAAHVSVAAQNIPELITLAKGQPKQFNYGTFGVGSIAHLNMESFSAATGTEFTAVHYRGAAPAFTDVIAGHISLTFVSFGSALPVWKAGNVKLLGIGRRERMPGYPELPTIAEGGAPGFKARSWFGLFAPAGTPNTVVSQLNTQLRNTYAEEGFRRRVLEPQYMEPLISTPGELAEQLRSETLYWREILAKTSLVPQ